MIRKIRIRKIIGAKARFCCEGCKESFQSDRECGLIYGQCSVDGKVFGWEEASIKGKFCAYCGKTVTN